MSVLRSHNNKTRGGLGRVCATGMYRSIEHVKFPKFQTGIFVEWKAPLVLLSHSIWHHCKRGYVDWILLHCLILVEKLFLLISSQCTVLKN